MYNQLFWNILKHPTDLDEIRESVLNHGAGGGESRGVRLAVVSVGRVGVADGVVPAGTQLVEREVVL